MPVAQPPAVAEPPPPAPAPALERRLGPLDAAAIIVSNVIGGGILFTPPQVAASVPSPWWFLLDVGGRRRAGVRRARWPTRSWRRCGRGPAASTSTCERRSAALAAFLTGWTSFIAGFSGAIAASAVVLAAYVGRFIPAANDATPLFVVPAAVRAAHVLAPRGDGALRDRA